MAFAERTTIGELISRIVLEPKLKDVFVEGHGDASLFSWFLRNNEIHDVVVSEIDRIHVPSELIASRGLRPGRRGAVITLALEICESLGWQVPQLLCIADRDGEDVEQYTSCNSLRFTDFACCEMYYFDQRVLGKVLEMTRANIDADPRRILDALTTVLVQLFAIRQANITLGLNLDWLSFDRCCELSETSEIRFDLDDFVRRYLNRGAKLSALQDFVAEFLQQVKLAHTDLRMQINGHDFVDLLAWYLHRTGLRRGSKSGEVAAMLAVAVENAWLIEHPLFRYLHTRYSPSKVRS